MHLIPNIHSYTVGKHKVCYMDIPALSGKKIRRDMGHGAPFRGRLNKKGQSQYVVIVSRSKELGLTAVGYMEAILEKRKRGGEYLKETEADPITERIINLKPGDEIVYISGPDKLPIIPFRDLTAYHFHKLNPHWVIESDSPRTPYWSKLKEDSVCVMLGDDVVEDEERLFGEFEKNSFKELTTNQHVYIVICGDPEQITADPSFSDLIFELDADMILLDPDKDNLLPYHKDIARTLFANEGMSFSRDDLLEQFVRKIEYIDSDRFIELCVKARDYMKSRLGYPTLYETNLTSLSIWNSIPERR